MTTVQEARAMNVIKKSYSNVRKPVKFYIKGTVSRDGFGF
jgi:hypothetical protein